MSNTYSDKIKYMMSRILEVRYTDLEEEKALCAQLLSRSEEHTDAYAKAFALTYLGDYYIASYDEKNAGHYLMQAQDLFDEDSCWDELRQRVYSLLGIYYDITADEQNAVDYYLKAAAAAEKSQDIHGECIALNNLAFVFQRHRCYKEALYYYEKAYEVQSVLEESPVRVLLLGNMVDVTLRMGKVDAAEHYIQECECLGQDTRFGQVTRYKNWCSYYSVVGNKEEALKYAELFLQNKELVDEDKLTAFEIYHILCQNMMSLGEAQYAGYFLKAMKEIDGLKNLEQQKTWEEVIISYAILFESPEQQTKAYRRFYEKNQQFRVEINQTITTAMKSRIQLEELQQQTQRMQSEQKTLEQEVNLDELTNVYSRRFLETLILEWQQKGEDSNLGFIIFDVDYFKEYNDFYGHLKGDLVLKAIGSCLMGSQIEGIFPCRYGGDEFVCLCGNVTANQMERYINAVTEPLQAKALVHEKSLCSDKVTLSIGYACREEKVKMEVHLLFQLADQALYESKRSGRNTYTRKRADVL